MTTLRRGYKPKWEQLLESRGIHSAALEAGWEPSGNGWQYPVYGEDGEIITRRWKAWDSDASPKYRWIPDKPEGANYYILAGTLEAIRETSIVYIASGEPDVLAFRAAGIRNVICWFGETALPKTLADDLERWGVLKTLTYPDTDNTGRKFAQKIVNALYGSKIEVNVLEWRDTKPDKTDINKIWIEADFEPSRFRQQLSACTPMRIKPELPEPTVEDGLRVIDLPGTKQSTQDAWEEFCSAISDRLMAEGFDHEGWSKAMPCIFSSHEHDDRKPAASWNNVTNSFTCLKCGETWNAIQTGEQLNLHWQDFKPQQSESPTDQDQDDTPKRHEKPTHDELGDMFIEDQSDDFRYMYGGWHTWDGGVWKFDEYRHLIKAWDLLKAHKWTGIRPTDKQVNGVLAYASLYMRVNDDDVDENDNYINLKNGVYNLLTNELEPHRRDLYFTSQLPFEYDAEAGCPMWKDFLRDVMRDETNLAVDGTMIQVVQEAFGYSLTADTRYRVSFWLVGPSGTGKSVLTNVLIALAGDAHITIDLDKLQKDDYQLADIAGKRVVTFTEPRTNGVLHDGHYKRLVSQDRIMARYPYGKPFRFVPRCKVWGAMNATPRVLDRSDAVFNRVIIIPMTRVIPDNKRNPLMESELLKELPGIFNWALEGLNRLRKQDGFTTSSRIEKEREQFRAKNDTELAFIQDVCDIHVKNKIKASELYSSYKQWCIANGFYPKSSKAVADDWSRLGFVSKRQNDGIYWLGLELNDFAN